MQTQANLKGGLRSPLAVSAELCQTYTRANMFQHSPVVTATEQRVIHFVFMACPTLRMVKSTLQTPLGRLVKITAFISTHFFSPLRRR